MKTIEWHDMNPKEYAAATVTRVIGGFTWLRMPKVYGDPTIWFVAVQTPVEIVREFARGTQSIRVQVYTGILPEHW